MAEIKQIVDPQGRQWVVLPAPPYIDGGSGQKLLDISLRLIEEGVSHLALDMGNTRVVNSIGISRLIQMIEMLEERNGTLAFCTPNKTIAKTFRIMGLLRKAALYTSVEEITAASDDSRQEAGG